MCLPALQKRRYRDRHLVENAFCWLKNFRRAATRYDKRAATFMSTVALATAVTFWCFNPQKWTSQINA